MKFRFRNWFCLLAIVLPLIVFGQAPQQKAAQLIRTFMNDHQVPGVAVTVGMNGQIIWSEGFGYADLEQRVPVWPAITRFRVGSVAKPMTAEGLMLLVEQGRVDLDAPVQTYVPTFPEKRWPVTTRELTGHLAGIRHYRGAEFLSLKHYTNVLSGLDIFENDTLLFKPGEKFSYSSYGWNLISAVVEKAAGESFLKYMQQRVFTPLRMEHTVADIVDSIIVNRSRYYEVENGVIKNAPPVDNSYKWAGGGFLSTSEDLARFGFAHLSNTLLKPETIATMWTSQKTNKGEATGYGIGWGSGTDDSGRRFAGHGGGSVGGTTFFRVYPDQQLVIVIIANMSGVKYNDLPQQVAELFMPE